MRNRKEGKKGRREEEKKEKRGLALNRVYSTVLEIVPYCKCILKLMVVMMLANWGIIGIITYHAGRMYVLYGKGDDLFSLPSSLY